MEKNDLTMFLAILEEKKWKIEYETEAITLPELFEKRYPKIPESYQSFLSKVKFCSNANETVWFNCISDFNGTSDSAFTWNEFEKQSLESADDSDLKKTIQSFWDDHIPFLISVKSGYAYLALNIQSGKIVFGEEPEYEETEEIYESFNQFIKNFGDSLKDSAPNSKINRF